MSLLNPIKEIVFDGRKPSYAQVMKAINEDISQGATDIAVLWGENAIHLYFDHGIWLGIGWIKNISGSDIADELNTFS